MEKRSRLGRGLSSLISSGLNDQPSPASAPPLSGTAATSDSSEYTSPSVQMFHVELSRVVRNVNQPRRAFDDTSLATLAQSIKKAGIIQPIVVRQLGEQFEVIAGERRLRAAKLAGLEQIPVILRPIDPLQQSQFALIENIHREDLNPMDRASAYRALLTQGNYTHQDLADELGEDRSTIANHLRLLDLEETVQKGVVDGKISFGHAKLLAGIDDPAEQARLAQLIVGLSLSVRKLEELIKKPKTDVAAAPKPPSAHIGDLERQISRDLQMRTEVRQAARGAKGRLVIHYASLDQFEEILTRLGVKLED